MLIQTLKGFRDFLPQEAKKRQYVINTLKEVFELYGFEPLETPALEYDEILTGKYGEEGDKLMYRFEDNGKRKVAMRYDQTVPLARVVAQYQNQLPIPFKRYQIQPVWRAENTQKGRYREFLQCDIDIVGVSSPLSDAELIATSAKGLNKLGFKNFKILINDRENLKFANTNLGGFIDLNDPNNNPVKFAEEDALIIRAIDKLKKIGEEKVIDEIVNNTRYSQDQAKKWIYMLTNEKKSTRYLQEIFNHLELLDVHKDQYEFAPTLARGLDYYTGVIFEIEIDGYFVGSVCGGGRYDNLIGTFAGKKIPAVGFAFGFDRIIEAMDELGLFPKELQQSSTKVLVTISHKDLEQKSIQVTSLLRDNDINTEIYLGEIKENNPIEKQLKYAIKKQIPYMIILGIEEAEKNMVTVKNLKTQQTQKQTISLHEAISLLKND
jgi:histidyl-tRNA synthetase